MTHFVLVRDKKYLLNFAYVFLFSDSEAEVGCGAWMDLSEGMCMCMCKRERERENYPFLAPVHLVCRETVIGGMEDPLFSHQGGEGLVQ